MKLPFGIAQIGKAFRNEITPRNFTFRSREFEQMEIEYFCRADAACALNGRMVEERLHSTRTSACRATNLTSSTIPEGELAFYSKGTDDIVFEFPFGVQELWGIALPRQLRSRRSTPRPAASRWTTSTRNRRRNSSRTSSSRPPASTAPCSRCFARPTTRRREGREGQGGVAPCSVSARAWRR